MQILSEECLCTRSHFINCTLNALTSVWCFLRSWFTFLAIFLAYNSEIRELTNSQEP